MGSRKLRLLIFLLPVLFVIAPKSSAFSLNLDSIATWGKFPRFCVNTYRWGDRFFNTYDTMYVVGTGYKFNGKITTDSWLDVYNFRLPSGENVMMRSDPSTSIGLYLTYLAVSAGYDINVSKLFNGVDRSRQRFRFGFNCSLFSAEFYMYKNNVGADLKEFGGTKLNIPFNGINNNTWGIDAYYFFNHKRYSEAAAFNFSRVQKRSQGSFFTGFSIYTQQLDFDFSILPHDLLDRLPDYWNDHRYRVDTHNYAIRAGYGYNWVFAPKWVLGVSESPIVGVRKGYVNSDIEKVSFSLYNRMKLAVVWNSGRWFAGIVGKFDAAIVNNRRTTYIGGVLSAEAAFGCRFNLW